MKPVKKQEGQGAEAERSRLRSREFLYCVLALGSGGHDRSSGGGACRQAHNEAGSEVPKSSLCVRVSRKVASDCIHGQRPVLSTTDENALVEYCLYSASYGFPLTKPQVLAHALAIYNQRHPQAPKVALGQTW